MTPKPLRRHRGSRRPPVALTIAGSDSGGGAGIQADLKTFAALGVYGASAIAAVTAQNTVEVRQAAEISPGLVAAQIDAVFDDLGVDAVKTGMLSSSILIETVAGKLGERQVSRLVVDPVMVAKSGDRLLREDALASLVKHLIPRARVVTPNLPEAETLVGFVVADAAAARKAARAIAEMGAGAVVIKGGHAGGAEAVDLYFDGRRFREFRAPRIPTRNTHGTGCTFSAAIAAHLARGLAVETAVERAKAYLTEALTRGISVGHGHGPVDHFAGCSLWRPRSARRN